MSDQNNFRPISRSDHVVLVVDDDPVGRYTTVRWLQHAGFQTREAATGMEGLNQADDGVSVMVLDVHLPDINGFELCRLLRSRPTSSFLPVLHLSAAFVTDEDKVRGLDSGADAYLTHPVDPAVLVATVQALVRTRVAEAALRRSERRFKAIFERATVGIGLLDLEGRVVEANPSMLGFMGRSMDQVTGRPLHDFVPPAFATEVRTLLALDPHSSGEKLFPIVKPDASWLEAEWRMLRDVEPGLHMVIATDITAKTLLEEQRQLTLQSERMARDEALRVGRVKDELIAVLSHELRTPLTTMMGWMHIFRRRPVSDANYQRGLEIIERNLLLQARLISDLLDMSSISLGKMRLSLEAVHVQEVIRSVVEASEAALLDKGLRVEFDAADGCPAIQADPARLQQIVSNLLGNAIKFSNHGGHIKISLKPSGVGVEVSVADQGAGIAKDFLPKLFDRFSQADVGSNRRHGGLGLGLSIVRHLVESHDGTVSAESDGPGQGATFRVWLPLSRSRAESAHPYPPGEHQDGDFGATLTGVSLLVLDDDPDIRTTLALILRDRGAEVRLASSFDEALSEIAKRRPDILLSDIGMPGKDGYDLIREIRSTENGTHLLAVAITSYTREQDRALALARGFDAHCSKPIQALSLVRTLQDLLRRSR
ncbi:MAG: response regulator [Pseudomonadota bacterium]